MNDTAHILVIPLQPVVTVTDTTHSQALVIPSNIWRAIDVWYCIKDPEIAGKVGQVIQQRLDALTAS